MGQAGANVIPSEWCSSHLGSGFELWLGGFSERDRKWAQRERIVRHWFTVKTRTEDHFSVAREDQKLGWRKAGARGDAIAGLSFHSQTSVKWLHLLCGLTLDTIIHYCTTTLPPSLSLSLCLSHFFTPAAIYKSYRPWTAADSFVLIHLQGFPLCIYQSQCKLLPILILTLLRIQTFFSC